MTRCGNDNCQTTLRASLKPPVSPSTPIFLTKEELRQLTGYARPMAQLRWIRDRGYLHEIDAKGRPVLMRDHVSVRLGGTLTATTREPRLRLA